MVHLCFLRLTFDLLLWSFDVAQHPGHVHAVPVHVLEEHICISPRQGARLIKTDTVGSDVRVKALLRLNSASFSVWECVTLRKASFCSRCLLIMGVTWSVSQLGPSLSAPPHQSSSLLYSCSKLSNTLHTCREKHSQVAFVSIAEETDPSLFSYLFGGLVEGNGGIDELESVLHF